MTSSSQELNPAENSMILGMVLLTEVQTLDLHKLTQSLKSSWDLDAEVSGSGDDANVLQIQGYTIGLLEIPMPIPEEEIERVSAYQYFWPNILEEASTHQAHIIISLLQADKDPILENLLFSQITASILELSPSLGVYLGGRTLLLSKTFYLENLRIMQNKGLPIYTWIYFGLRQENDKNSVYSFGLKDFQKTEMEILDSEHSFEDLLTMIYTFTHYVLESNIELKNGETIGLSEDQKLNITLSPGKYLEGDTLKISY